MAKEMFSIGQHGPKIDGMKNKDDGHPQNEQMDERLVNQNIQPDAGNAQKRRDQRAAQRDEGLIFPSRAPDFIRQVAGDQTTHVRIFRYSS
ncbi:hypothetical protein [Caenibacillus caldisaponilyticus]|uniref:hypothetical protein n=1 Tax=Caenibacillus caldisaponilyticus TaxID=1674942 RepID=UPI001178AA26|nr:hypothetical protein [Caenibacillus caldisaponilyticus]